MQIEMTGQEIAVLKSEMTAQSKSISDLTRSIEKLLELATSIARMQERMEKHADGLDRAFKRIEQLDSNSNKSVSDLEGELEKKAEALGSAIEKVSENLDAAIDDGEEDRRALRGEISHWVQFGKGAWAAASILWLLIAWLLVRQIDTMESGISTANSSVISIEKRLSIIESRNFSEVPQNGR